MSQQIGWGHLAPYQAYGTAGDKKDDFKLLEYEDAKSNFKESMHGSHAMIFARDDNVLWNLYPAKAAILVKYFNSILDLVRVAQG